jgi:hypothetical protein
LACANKIKKRDFCACISYLWFPMNSILEISDKQPFYGGLCGPGLRKAVVAIICLAANLVNLLTSLRNHYSTFCQLNHKSFMTWWGGILSFHNPHLF